MGLKSFFKGWRWILDGNLWLGSCAAALTFYVGLARCNTFWTAPALWVASYVIGVYNLHGISSLRRKQLFDLNAARYYKSKLALMVVFASMAMACLLLLLAPSFLWLPGFAGIMISFLYGNRVKVKGLNLPALREWPYIKGLGSVLALVFIIDVIPSVWMEYTLIPEDGVLTALLAIHLWINTTVGDMRDGELDARKGLKTLPTLWGFDKARWVLMVVSLGTGGLATFLRLYPMSILFAGNAMALYCIKKESSKKIYHWVDVVHWLPFVVACILRWH